MVRSAVASASASQPPNTPVGVGCIGNDREFREILQNIGQRGDLNGKARESLVSLGRLLAFAVQGAQSSGRKTGSARLKTVGRDIASLSDFTFFQVRQRVNN